MCESDFRSIERDGAEVSMSGDDVDSPCIMVVFGASGDLTRKKLIPALYSLDCDGLLDDNFTIVGFARSDKSREEFRNEIRDTIQKFSRKGLFSPEVWERFSSRLHYFTGQYDDPTSHIKFGKFLGQLETVCGARRYLYYLALPVLIMRAPSGSTSSFPLFLANLKFTELTIISPKTPYG
ncbi:MAG: hypothetical protein AMS15_01885, partial [Planctomycetes bacterium DG_23]